MNEEERTYEAGKRRALINMFMHFAREFATVEVLTDEPKEKEEAAIRKRLAVLEAERLETVTALRRLCAKHGDNKWSDGLHLSDVIEKHLARFLR